MRFNTSELPIKVVLKRIQLEFGPFRPLVKYGNFKSSDLKVCNRYVAHSEGNIETIFPFGCYCLDVVRFRVFIQFHEKKCHTVAKD